MLCHRGVICKLCSKWDLSDQQIPHGVANSQPPVSLHHINAHRIGGAYCNPPSDSRAFNVPLLGMRQADIDSDPLYPS